MDEARPTDDPRPEIEEQVVPMDEVGVDAGAADTQEAPEPTAETPVEPTAETPVEPTAETPVEPTAEPEPVSEPTAETPVEPTAEPEPVSAPTAETPVEPVEPADQLSLDEMVESLKEDVPADAEPDASDTDAEPDASDAEAVPPDTTAVTADSESGQVDAPDTLVRDRLAARLPFWIYVFAWAVFCGVMGYLLWPVAAAAFVGTRHYAYFVLGGAALTLCGPALGLGVWMSLRGSAGTPAGLARAVFMRAAVATLAGDVLWWLVLVALDLHRAGALG
jgi:hypothetical protein